MVGKAFRVRLLEIELMQNAGASLQHLHMKAFLDTSANEIGSGHARLPSGTCGLPTGGATGGLAANIRVPYVRRRYFKQVLEAPSDDDVHLIDSHTQLGCFVMT